jgi:hypothetical protein
MDNCLFIKRRVCKAYGVKKYFDMDKSLFINRRACKVYGGLKYCDKGFEYYKGSNTTKGLNLFKDSSPLLYF